MVIDELILVLGLDASKFKEGSRDAMDAFRKTKDQTEEFGKGIEAQGMKMSEVFSIVRKGALGILGAFAGAEAVSFIDHVIGMDAATGRMAKTIGTSVENLAQWQNMVRQVGGSAESAASSLSALQQQIETVRQGGGMFETGFASLMNQAGVSIRDDADTSLKKIRAYLAGQVESGKMKPEEAATYLRRVPGMNPDMLNLLLSTTKAFEGYAAAARAAGGATRDSAEAAAYFQSKVSLLIQKIEELARKMIPVFSFLTKPLNEMGRKDFLSILPEMEFEKGSVMDRLDKFLWGDASERIAAERAGDVPAGDRLKDAFSALSPGGRSSASDRETWIRSYAQAVGIDPQVALGVARSEGFSAYSGDRGTSFGDFQLHLTPGGRGKAVGDAFKAETGLDPSDPANERAMDEFALRWAAAHGWGDFHGAARTGIGQWQGIGARGAATMRGGGAGAGQKTSTSTNTVTIGKIDINAPNATDADGIAHEMGSALKRQSLIAPVNFGLV